MKLNSSIANSGFLRTLGDVATTFAEFGWVTGDIASQSIVLNDADLQAYFIDEFNPVEYQLNHTYPNLKNRFILVTVDGVPTRNIKIWAWKVHKYCGIVRITPDGKGYTIVWGLKSGSPTKRFEEHLAIHNAAIARDPNHAAVSFASPSSTQQVSYHFAEDNEEKYSYLLWKGYPDLARLAPQGIGVARNLADLESDLWTCCAEKFQKYNALILQYQGVFVASSGWDGVMGLTEAIDRAAQSVMALGVDNPPVLPGDFFTRLAAPLNLELNPAVLVYGSSDQDGKKDA